MPSRGASYAIVASGMNATRELALAHDIQRILVPSVMLQNALQAYGRTVPGDKVGGDFMDLAAAGTKWLAYVADVSNTAFQPMCSWQRQHSHPVRGRSPTAACKYH